jgi:hypothetical protein
LRYSGSSTGPATSTSSITGAAIRNTEPHQKCCSSNPPSTGPTAALVKLQVAQIEMARPRCRPSANMLVISASVDGIRAAPASPSSSRAAISIVAPVEKAASTDAAPNPAAPISRSLRRPIRSPRVPIVITNPAVTKP